MQGKSPPRRSCVKLSDALSYRSNRLAIARLNNTHPFHVVEIASMTVKHELAWAIDTANFSFDISYALLCMMFIICVRIPPARGGVERVFGLPRSVRVTLTLYRLILSVMIIGPGWRSYNWVPAYTQSALLVRTGPMETPGVVSRR